MEKKPAENSVSRFLDEVTDQIAWKPLHPSIRQELEEHIEDLADYKSSREAAKDGV